MTKQQLLDLNYIREYGDGSLRWTLEGYLSGGKRQGTYFQRPPWIANPSPEEARRMQAKRELSWESRRLRQENAYRLTQGENND